MPATLLLALFLVAHGAIHLSFLAPRPPVTADGPPWPFVLDRSWVLSPRGVRPELTRILGLALAAVTFAAFVLAAAERSWSCPSEPLGARDRPWHRDLHRPSRPLLPPLAGAGRRHRRRAARGRVHRRVVTSVDRVIHVSPARADRPTGMGRRSLRWACSASEHSAHGYRHTPCGRPASIDRS